jgi:hypothetical protein
LFAYITEADFDANVQKVIGSINKESLDLLESTNLLQRVISVVKNGHTEIDFPAQPYLAYAKAGGVGFPLELALEDNKVLVRKNWSGNSTIKTGAEVLSINGMPIKQILAKIYPQISAERPYFKKVKLEVYSFPRYYWQVFGSAPKYEVETRTNGVVTQHTLKAIGLMKDFEMKRNEVLNAKMTLKFFGQRAYLNPGNFGGDKQKYEQFISEAFAKIKAKGSNTLIIDLRNNGGGGNAFSDYMVSYIADKPFKWCSRFTLKTSALLKAHLSTSTDTTSAYWQAMMHHPNGKTFPFKFELYQPQPVQKRFTGQVYVLINRHSHSQSSVTAAQIQDYKWGTIVGEETGDYTSLYASQFHYLLPNTKVMAKVSKGYMVRVSGSTAQRGVMPDIIIKDHLLDDKDEILTGLLKRLDKGR